MGLLWSLSGRKKKLEKKLLCISGLDCGKLSISAIFHCRLVLIFQILSLLSSWDPEKYFDLFGSWDAMVSIYDCKYLVFFPLRAATTHLKIFTLNSFLTLLVDLYIFYAVGILEKGKKKKFGLVCLNSN